MKTNMKDSAFQNERTILSGFENIVVGTKLT